MPNPPNAVGPPFSESAAWCRGPAGPALPGRVAQGGQGAASQRRSAASRVRAGLPSGAFGPSAVRDDPQALSDHGNSDGYCARTASVIATRSRYSASSSGDTVLIRVCRGTIEPSSRNMSISQSHTCKFGRSFSMVCSHPNMDRVKLQRPPARCAKQKLSHSLESLHGLPPSEV